MSQSVLFIYTVSCEVDPGRAGVSMRARLECLAFLDTLGKAAASDESMVFNSTHH